MTLAGLRVTVVGPIPPPNGGMANQTAQLAAMLRTEGVVAEILAVNAPYRPKWIGKFVGIRALFRLVPYVVRLWNSAVGTDLFHVMANSGWSWYLFAVPAIHVARLRRVAVVVHYHGGEAREFLARSSGRVRRSMRFARSLIVPSEFLVEAFRQYGMQAVVVPNVIDLTRFQRVETDGARCTLTFPHLVVTRNLERVYGIDTAIRAFALVLARYPTARLSIAGSGPERLALQHLVDKLGLGIAVRFTGRLDGDAVVALLATADVMLNPSREDNTPISILEALAAGVPVVSTRAGGILYMLEHERTAMLVPIEDPVVMAAAILRVLEDPDLRARLTCEGFAEVRRYSWVNIRTLLCDVYQSAIDGERGGESIGARAT